MAKRKSPAELKAEGAELSSTFASVRKRPHNFALSIGKEGLVLEAHPKKSPDMLWRAAKANGGGPKGSQGVMTISGKLLEFACADDNVPGNLGKLAKKHFAERGLAYKVVIKLPGGELGDDDDGEDEDMAPKAKARDRAHERPVADPPDTTAIGDPPDATPVGDPTKEDTTQEVTPQTEPKPGFDIESLRQTLLKELRDMGGQIGLAAGSGNKGAAKKVAHLAKLFATEIKSEDLKKATQVMTLLKRTVQDALKTPKPAASTGSADALIADINATLGTGYETFLRVSDAVIEDSADALEDAAQFVGDAVGVLSDADEAQKARLAGFGLSDAQMLKLVQDQRDDPKAIDAALGVLASVKTLKLPPRQFDALMAMNKTDPKTYASTVAAMQAIDPTGGLDVSTEAITTSLQAIQTARVDLQAKRKIWAPAYKADKAAKKEKAAKKKIRDAADAAKKAADTALQDFKNSLPADLTTLSEADRATAVAKSTALINTLEASKTKLTAAQTAYDAAKTAQVATAATLKTAVDAYFVSKSVVDAAEAKHQKLDNKRGLIDAVSFGALSPDAKHPMESADKVKLIEAYAKDPQLGQEALDLAGDMEDPSLIVENVDQIIAKFQDGFADASGTGIAATDEAKRAMATTALKMGASRGQDYFDDFKTYLASGEQLKPDPCGGLGTQVGRVRRKEKGEISVKRTNMMADAALGADGKVDFTSPKAKGALDHMLFHPGSLQTPSPHTLAQMENTKDLFAHGTDGPKAQTIVDNTKLPGAGDAHGNRAKKLISQTTDTPEAGLSDAHAKTAVLSAMMTPMSQGPVGSCFSTAPVRAIRETKPLDALQAYSDIATKGTFQPASGVAYPANLSAHEGENPLMRSWEYSTADAAANLANSSENRRLNYGLMGAPAPGTKNLGAVKDIVGAAAWTGTVDPDSGDLVPGIKSKLQAAIRAELDFVYNAAPETSDGSGDGHSTRGGYEIHYKKKPVLSEEDFLKAIGAIALDAAGETKDSEKGGKILLLVRDPDFKKAILKSGGDKDYVPWNRKSGGMEDQTVQVLHGGTPSRDNFITTKSKFSMDDEGDRSLDVLNSVLDVMKDMPGEMGILSTTGEMGHGFNALPNHPSLDKIKDPDSAAKIEKELLEPGRKIAQTELSVAHAGAVFEKTLRKLAEAQGSAHPALLSVALEKRPDEAMTSEDLDAHIVEVCEDFRKAYAKAKADAWKEKQEEAGIVVSTSDYDTEQAKQSDAAERMVSDAASSVLVAEFDTPQVVIADANWGGPDGQTYFVMAPDPSTGKLRLWKKDEFSGSMRPAEQEWVDGPWNKLKD